MASVDTKLMHDVENSPVGSLFDEKAAALPAWSKQQPVKHYSVRSTMVTLQWIFINIFSTVTVVFMNKVDPQLKNCQMTVAAWHFITTALVLYGATLVKMFPAVHVPFKSMLPISIFFAGFLILGNLSLTYNSLGFYQLAKVMTTPTVVLLNFALFGIMISGWSCVAILAVCAGVLMVLTTGLADNMLGAIFAAAAFTVTALYQIWIGKKITDLKVSGSQLLLNQSPVAACILLVMAPFVDTIPSPSGIPSNTLYALIGSGILASLLNLSQFLIIERTNALTFNVISQVKTIIIVSLSWYSEGRALTLQDLVGVTLTLGGAYTYSILQAKKR